MKILGQTLTILNKQVDIREKTPVQASGARLKTLTKDTVSFSGASEAAKAAINLSRKTIQDLPLDLTGMRVFLKVDHNLPAGDNTRMVASLPTIKELLQRNAKIIIGTHIGDPYKLKDGKMGKKVSTKENAEMLQELLRQENRFKNVEVIHTPNITGDDVVKQSYDLKKGQILYLENLRFHPSETGKDAIFDVDTQSYKSIKLPQSIIDLHSERLAALADIYVNDAFGAAHRPHASVTGITKFIQGPKVAGLLMDKEIKYLAKPIENPVRPLVAIIGGSKVSSKITVLDKLIDKVNTLIVGGGMAHTFTLAKGGKVGKSLVEADQVELANKIIAKAKEKGVKLVLPTDAIAADAFSNDAHTIIVGADKIPEGMMGLDIGTKSVEEMKEALKGAKTILWNGPVGVFELPKFATGTNEIAKEVANVTERNKAESILGGGDTVASIKLSGIPEDKFTHISTGGGASLEMLEKNGDLPGIRSLDEK